MNRQGVALAADSAVTMSGEEGSKILSSANKIFALSKYRPVGVMVYGNASLLGVPWETIIKAHRSEVGDRGHDSLDGYVADFLAFLEGSRDLFPTDAQQTYVRANIGPIFRAIAKEVRAAAREDIDAGKSVSGQDAAAFVSQLARAVRGAWENQPLVLGFADGDESRLRKDYAGLFQAVRRQAFEKLPLDQPLIDQLDDVAVLLLTREPPTQVDGVTGVVIAGFGTRDLFPSFREVLIDGVAGDRLIGWKARSRAITRAGDSYLGAFAQWEMVNRFMEGVDPDYSVTVAASLDELLAGYTREVLRLVAPRISQKRKQAIDEARRDLLAAYQNALAARRQDEYVSSILSVVASHPLPALAEVAESLVNLTVFKRRVSMESETVGGPVDVAVISPGDGFIWIQRKHYFDRHLNPQFFANYYREG